MDPFTGDTPCQWCGAVPTASEVVIPAEVAKRQLVKREIRADLCRACARRMRLGVAGGKSSRDLVAARAQSRAYWRGQRRQTMRANQGSLFEPEHLPTDAIRGG